MIRFGNYEVDLAAGHPRKHGIKLKIVDRSFDVPAILLEHADAGVALALAR